MFKLTLGGDDTSHQEKVSVRTMKEKLDERLAKSREISDRQAQTTEMLLKKTEERLKEVRR